MYTYKRLWTDVLRYFDLDLEATGSDVDLAKAAVQAAHQQRCAEDNWTFLLSSQFTLPVVSGTQEYILPHDDFGRFWFLYSPTTLNFLTELPQRETPYADVVLNGTGPGILGPVDTYQMIGFAPVKVQPGGSVLTLTSSDAEAASPTFYIEGEDSDGNSISTTLSKDGVSTETFTKITSYTKMADFVGTITLSAGATTLVVLSPTQYAKQYPVLRFVAVPNVADNMIYQYLRSGKFLVNDYDIPSIPYPDSYVLVYDALLDSATYNELDSESVNIWREKQQLHLTNLYMRKLAGNTLGGTSLTVNSTGAFNY